MITTERPNVPIADFGKDHWSLLGYVEGRCVEHGGRLNNAHMRDKRESGWDKDIYGTQLFGYWTYGAKGMERHPERRLCYHDDYDCLSDLESAGLCVNIGRTTNPIMTMTDLGYQVLTEIKKHKEHGGTFSNFVWKS
jgi:hypothetical protein